jgi:hypothetical protein
MATPLEGAVQRLIFFGLISWVFPVSAAFGAQPTCPFSTEDGVLSWFTSAVAGLCPTPTPIPVAEPLAANMAVAIQSVASAVTSFSVDYSFIAIMKVVEEVQEHPSVADIMLASPTAIDGTAIVGDSPDAAAD